ncbi:hypothetical protein TREMEDRAFT_58161 [Tremella mesenterica DSM 1558]|uniref:uncharacterized protein n=1 Tax=Tremella mesenterica (strain ATCC 24925 / CBS 8224 / DSM 1558 / NBRC 9311 / NRRL Y-6157 / RJB 2259-6 / UBC 559-6) TaxID=578456 RepID=UPI0003F4A2D7|nr:uncharacterized protein TREMEDRAFT_58161 [Tremella mesenterica DSM 1558]EIW72017.1 hypothetical protein TREMEDRAFT_58161 [Tremella mesenterica DSM 1558]
MELDTGPFKHVPWLEECFLVQAVSLSDSYKFIPRPSSPWSSKTESIDPARIRPLSSTPSSSNSSSNSKSHNVPKGQKLPKRREADTSHLHIPLVSWDEGPLTTSAFASRAHSTGSTLEAPRLTVDSSNLFLWPNQKVFHGLLIAGQDSIQQWLDTHTNIEVLDRSSKYTLRKNVATLLAEAFWEDCTQMCQAEEVKRLCLSQTAKELFQHTGSFEYDLTLQKSWAEHVLDAVWAYDSIRTRRPFGFSVDPQSNLATLIAMCRLLADTEVDNSKGLRSVE